MLDGMDPRPVGMFDSGVGGLSVFREFRRLAPRERTVYFADTAYFPYGPRDTGEVRIRSGERQYRMRARSDDLEGGEAALEAGRVVMVVDVKDGVAYVAPVGMKLLED